MQPHQRVEPVLVHHQHVEPAQHDTGFWVNHLSAEGPILPQSPHRTKAWISLATLALACLLMMSPAAANPPTRIHIKFCNSVAFTQLPGSKDLFIGRIQNTADPTKCMRRTSWTLALFRMDWHGHTFSLVKPLLALPVSTSDGYMLTTAYDPHAVTFKDEIWVAFECAGSGPRQHVSACVAPYDPKNHTLDMKRASVPIPGARAPEMPRRYSASVPKLLVLNGRLFIYWTVMEQDNGTGAVLSITQRSTELALDHGRLYPLPYRQVYANDSRLTTAVMAAPGKVADITDIIAGKDGKVIALAATGEQRKGNDTCVNPTGTTDDCYFLQVFETMHPSQVFNETGWPDADLPFRGPNEYARIVRTPSGPMVLSRTFKSRYGNTPDGLFLYPLQSRLVDSLGVLNR